MPDRRHLIVMLFASFGLATSSHGLAQVRDVELKAAYIYNFAMFTTWPEANAAGAAARGALLVCASADSVLWSSLQSLNGRPVNGRPWTVIDLALVKGQHCDIAVLPRSVDRLPPAMSGVLVVRDGPGHGAAITLVDDDEHVRFDVDTQEAARSGLRFSSRLLRLARNVQ
jgi:hypothetical protein